MKTLQSIRTKQEFQTIFDHGLIHKGKFLKLWIVSEKRDSETKGALRLAIIVSRKTAAKATDRNTWKRRIREIMRKKFASKYENAAIIVQVRKSGPVASSYDIEEELDNLFRRAA